VVEITNAIERPDSTSEAIEAQDGASTLTGDPVVDEASRRFERCTEWDAAWRERFVEDLKFRHGDSDNGYQWPNAVRRSRDVDAKPCLTINVIRQHNLMITNEMRRNKSEVRFVGAGNGATAESAEMFDMLAKQIQWSSQAQNAYTTARAFQVDGGVGYWRLTTDYVENEFYQEIGIQEIPDPLSVYLDPDTKKCDASDARFGFVFDLVPKAQWRDTYPEFSDFGADAPLGDMSVDDGFTLKDHVRIVEYFRIVQSKDTLWGFDTPRGWKTMRESRLKLIPDAMDRLGSLASTQRREIQVPKVEWFLIAGQHKIDETIWPGSHIPIIRCLGEETVIEGILDRKGHTRAMKDAQRMFNYNASSQVEHVALQTKTPWTAAAAAIEEHEQAWNNANRENKSVLVFNHLDDDGNPLPAQALPQRQQPPAASPAYKEGMDSAFNQMMMASGQWQNQMGMQGNERTGEAIKQRQDQGDTATFHFKDNFDVALMHTGRQLIELIPLIYDTERVIRIQADDGDDFDMKIDPQMAQAAQLRRANDGTVAERIFNPQVGRYDVRGVPGNAGTRREDTVNALTLILTQAPNLTGIIGDLLLRAMDFKEAQEAAQRLRRMVPPQALGEGPSQAEQNLQQQLVQTQQALAQALQKLGKEQLKLTGKDQMRDIDAYKAETDRLKALMDALMLDQGGLENVVHQTLLEAAQTHLVPILQANAEGVQEQGGSDKDPAATAAATPGAPIPGARAAPDGEWYLSDPTRQGKYLRLAPLAQERRPRNVISNA
jgi:hypothetical protein